MIGFGQTNTLGSNIVNPDSEIKEVFSDGEGLLLEGPTMGPDGILYFSDLTFTQFTGMKAGIIWQYNPKTAESKVVKTDMKSGKSTILAGLFNDRPFNSPNDIVVDNNGRIYFTDPRYFGKESIDQPLDGVYRIDTEGTIHLIIANASKPNGIAISPDYKTLYIANYDLGHSNLQVFPKGFKGPVPEIKGTILEYTLLSTNI